jgi:hypothetical protein
VSARVGNDYSFPVACTIRFRFGPKAERPALDLFWYDGGMKPPTPEELEANNRELAAEGMMFVGDKGKILAGFRCEDPQLIPEGRAREFWGDKGVPPAAHPEGSRADAARPPSWVQAFQGGPPSEGDFLLAGPISEAFNLGAVSLRLGGKRLVWDAQAASICNVPEANKYLTREYRKGWELNA